MRTLSWLIVNLVAVIGWHFDKTGTVREITAAMVISAWCLAWHWFLVDVLMPKLRRVI